MKSKDEGAEAPSVKGDAVDIGEVVVTACVAEEGSGLTETSANNVGTICDGIPYKTVLV